MPATPLPQTVRYTNFDLTKILFLPAVSSAALTPTRAEINAGTDLTPEIADMSGWSVTSGEIDAPDLGSDFTSKTPGRTSADDSSLTFYADKTGNDVRNVLSRGVTGFIAIMDGGDVDGQDMDVFPVRVRSAAKTRSVGEENAKIQVAFSITRKPAIDVAIPAAV